jgi:ATP-dependent DNA helicase RecQ
MIKHLNAGYVIASFWNRLRSEADSEGSDGLLRHLSAFTLEGDFVETEEERPEIAIIGNIISRGLPTFPSLYVEDLVSERLGIALKEVSDRTNDTRYRLPPKGDGIINMAKAALAIIDPRFSRRDPLLNQFDLSGGTFGSATEEKVFHDLLPSLCGDFICQITQPQRSIHSILRGGRNLPGLEFVDQQFWNQAVDFSIEVPAEAQGRYGLIIEVDGESHDNEAQKRLDAQRDTLCLELGHHRTVRIQNKECSNMPANKRTAILKFAEHPYLQNLSRNYREPLYGSTDGLTAMQMALTPFGIARIQLALVEAIRSGFLSLDSSVWNIAVIERDVPCAKIAIDDLCRTLSKLEDLAGNGLLLPEIDLKIYRTAEFKDCELGDDDAQLYGIDVSDWEADLLLDISVLQRRGFSAPTPEFTERMKSGHQIRQMNRSRSRYSIFCKISSGSRASAKDKLRFSAGPSVA